MTDVDFVMIANLANLVMITGFGVDRYWFEKDRIIKRMMSDMKEGERCIICRRPITIVPDEEIEK